MYETVFGEGSHVSQWQCNQMFGSWRGRQLLRKVEEEKKTAEIKHVTVVCQMNAELRDNLSIAMLSHSDTALKADQIVKLIPDFF